MRRAAPAQSPAASARVHAAADSAGVAVTPIGQIESKPGLRVIDVRGQALALHWRGFDHFAS